MRTKIYSLILICLVVVIAISLGEFKTVEHSESKKQDNLKQVKVRTKSVKKIKFTNDSKREEIENKVFLEITTNRYSDDLIIETTALVKELSNCEGLKYYDETDKQNFRYKFTKIQKEIINKSLNDCHILLKKYPIISKVSNKLFNPAIKHLAKIVNSPFSQLFTQHENYRDMSVLEKIEYKQKVAYFLIESKNSQLTLHLQDLIMDYETGDVLDLSHVLGTIDLGYIGLIGFQATLLFSCEFNQGITCVPTSTYMVNQCVNHEEACGKDLTTWFEINNTPAHNRDIQKVVEYFKSFE